jgi:hypothetical protein
MNHNLGRIKVLARLGGEGEHFDASHVERDFWRLRWSEQDVLPMPELHFMDLTVRSDKRHGIKTVKHPVLPPTDWLCTMSKNQDVLEATLGCDHAIEEYWAYERGRPLDMRHPFLDLVDAGSVEAKYGVPYALHGDDVAVFNNEKVLVMSIRSLTASRYPKYQHLLFTVLPYSLIVDGVTLDEIYECFVHFANSAYLGEHARTDLRGELWHNWRRDVAGEPLCHNRRLIFAQGEGDWKWVKETFHYQGYAHNSCCQFCMASKVIARLYYTSLGPEAAWRFARITNDAYHAHWDCGQRPALTYLIGFHLYRNACQTLCFYSFVSFVQFVVNRIWVV